MPRRKKPTRRRAPKRMSLINLGVSFAVADAATKAFAGTNLLAFATEGWLTDVTSGSPGPGATGSGSSWTFSAAELVRGLIPGGAGFGMSTVWQDRGMWAAVQQNFRDHGAMAIGTAVAAPLAGKLLRRVARAPIRDANKLLKWSGISSALGVKI
jgi:hypothetical protein